MSALPNLPRAANGTAHELLRVYSVQYSKPEDIGFILGATAKQLASPEFSRQLLCAIEYLSALFKSIAPTSEAATETLVELAKTSIPLEANELTAFDYEAGHDLNFRPARLPMQ
jgi:hypothetical protein